jgi:hypothetical protein
MSQEAAILVQARPDGFVSLFSLQVASLSMCDELPNPPSERRPKPRPVRRTHRNLWPTFAASALRFIMILAGRCGVARPIRP